MSAGDEKPTQKYYLGDEKKRKKNKGLDKDRLITRILIGWCMHC